jgi:hypothetical protein
MVRNLLVGLAAAVLGTAAAIQSSEAEGHPTGGIVAPLSGA